MISGAKSKPSAEWMRANTARWIGQRVACVLYPESSLAVSIQKIFDASPLVSGIFQSIWITPALHLQLRDCIYGSGRLNISGSRIGGRSYRNLTISIPVRQIFQWRVAPSVKGLVDILIKSEELDSEVILLE